MSEIPDRVNDPLEVPKGETLCTHAINFYALEILRGTHPSPLTLQIILKLILYLVTEC